MSFICISLAWSEFGSIRIQSGTLGPLAPEPIPPPPPPPPFGPLNSTTSSSLRFAAGFLLGASKKPRLIPFLGTWALGFAAGFALYDAASGNKGQSVRSVESSVSQENVDRGNEWGDSLGNRTPDLSQTALHHGQVGHTAAHSLCCCLCKLTILNSELGELLGDVVQGRREFWNIFLWTRWTGLAMASERNWRGGGGGGREGGARGVKHAPCDDHHREEENHSTHRPPRPS